MTTIDFYTHVSDRHRVVATIVAKALAKYGSVRVLTGDAARPTRSTGCCGCTPATGFIPHCRMDSPLAARTPVWIDHRARAQWSGRNARQSARGPAAVLQPVRAPGGDRRRIDDDVAAGRERYQVLSRARLRAARARPERTRVSADAHRAGAARASRRADAAQPGRGRAGSVVVAGADADTGPGTRTNPVARPGNARARTASAANAADRRTGTSLHRWHRL